MDLNSVCLSWAVTWPSTSKTAGSSELATSGPVNRTNMYQLKYTSHMAEENSVQIRTDWGSVVCCYPVLYCVDLLILLRQIMVTKVTHRHCCAILCSLCWWNWPRRHEYLWDIDFMIMCVYKSMLLSQSCIFKVALFYSQDKYICLAFFCISTCMCLKPIREICTMYSHYLLVMFIL